MKPNNCAIYEELDNSETIYDDIDDVPPPPPVRNQSLKSDPAAPPVPRRSHDNEEKPPPLPPKDIALDSDDVINYNDDVFNAGLLSSSSILVLFYDPLHLITILFMINYELYRLIFHLAYYLITYFMIYTYF